MNNKAIMILKLLKLRRDSFVDELETTEPIVEDRLDSITNTMVNK